MLLLIMLTISKRQRGIFAAASRDALAGRLAEQFARHFPVQTGFSGVATLRAAAAWAIARGEAVGCTTEREAAHYLLLSWLMGHEFATDPRQPWAAEWLVTFPGTTVGFRLARLLDIANEQIDLVHGPDNGLLVRSLLRVRRLKQDDFLAAGVAPTVCATWLADVLPGWAKERDGAALDAVAEAAPAAAARLGLDGPAPVATIALHCALLGHGFATDPLYPWAGAALRGSDPDRAERLFAVSLRYVEAILK
jgi:hypothetical protein